MDKLTPRQHFKVGFIMQCIQEGDTTPEAIEKRANEVLNLDSGSMNDASEQLKAFTAKAQAKATEHGSTIGGWGLAGAAGVPAALGAAGGGLYGLLAPGEDAEGKKRSRLMEALKRGLLGGTMGAGLGLAGAAGGVGGGMYGVKRVLDQEVPDWYETLNRLTDATSGLSKASVDKEAFIGKTIDLAKELGGTALSWMIPLGLAAPPIAGAGLGYAAARATDIDDTDVEEARQQELIEEYRRQSAKIKRRKMMSQLRRTPMGATG